MSTSACRFMGWMFVILTIISTGHLQDGPAVSLYEADTTVRPYLVMGLMFVTAMFFLFAQPKFRTGWTRSTRPSKVYKGTVKKFVFKIR